MTVTKFSLNERFLHAMAFVMQNIDSVGTEGMDTRILNACFAEVLF